MEDLGMGRGVQDISLNPRGLVLTTGPTGSGKSTTLAAMIDFINDTKYDHILTIETRSNSCMKVKCLVNQREVHRDTLGFSEALRSASGKTRTSFWLGNAGSGNHSIGPDRRRNRTLGVRYPAHHIRSETIDRVVDVFPPREEKAMVRSMPESLQAVVSQSL